MNAREFYYATKNMRRLQKRYFAERTQELLRACKMAEKEVDEEIWRVSELLGEDFV